MKSWLASLCLAVGIVMLLGSIVYIVESGAGLGVLTMAVSVLLGAAGVVLLND